jgi:hypothetical protein
MAIRTGPAAAGALDEGAAVDAGAAAEVVGAGGVDELDEHPAITAAVSAITTPPAAMRARSNLYMVLTAPLQRKAREPIYVESSPGSAEAERISGSRPDQDLVVPSI